MAQKLFSKDLKPYTGNIDNERLRESLAALKSLSESRNFPILEWDEGRIAVSLKIKVELPPLGNHEGIDIRAEEHIIVVFNLDRYPTVSPIIFTDRLDFPKDKLAHLYVATANKPPALCVVRGDANEWYAVKNIKDLIIRTRNWYRDAAVGELSENGDEFDPLRLEGYRGTVIYSHAQLANIVEKSMSLFPDGNFAMGLFEKTSSGDDPASFKLEKVVPITDVRQSLQNYRASIRALVESKTFKLKQYHFGYIVWSKVDTRFTDYNIDLPKDWQSLQKFLVEHKIDYSQLEEQIATRDLNLLPEIPIIVAVKRPKTLIGFSSYIEFVNFYLEIKDEDKQAKQLINNKPVYFQAHNEPLSTQKAREISGSFPKLSGTAIVGCGALGSKIVMHFIRNGVTEFTLFDSDKLSPHNLVRHALLAEYEGMNKAIALAKVIRNTYRYEELPEHIGLPFSGEIMFGLLKAGLPESKAIFDFTASESFLNTLINQKDIQHIKIYRAGIHDEGNLGIMYVEGKERNPRLDDMQMFLYSQSEVEPLVADWLQREANLSQNDKPLVHIGVGCNSETTILSDEKISSHASYFAGSINQITNTADIDTEGKVYISKIETGGDYNCNTKVVRVPPFIVIPAVNDKAWEIRIKPGLIEIIRSEMGLAMPHETGGIFIGGVNLKTKTIHITDIVTAPSDSRSNPVCFCRGIHGLPERVKQINDLTGNQLGYVGEWHTHPFGPEDLSSTDMKAVKKFKVEFESLPSPLPVLLLISTPKNIYPFVY